MWPIMGVVNLHLHLTVLYHDATHEPGLLAQALRGPGVAARAGAGDGVAAAEES
jgi:hypothetical protein